MTVVKPRVLLFEWMLGGHFERYIRRFAEALMRTTTVAVAAPDETCERLESLPVTFIPLGPPRPEIKGLEASEVRSVVEKELDLFESAIGRFRPDHAIHLYSDRVLRRLVARRPLRARTTICIFRPRIHYPLSYRTPLPPRELAKAAFLETMVARWRRRDDAHAVLTLDEGAARRWMRGRGAPAFWLPEPPVAAAPARPPEPKWDCCLYGALSERKGVRQLARAVASAPTSARVTLAGSVDAGFERSLDGYVTEMASAGAQIDVRAWTHTEEEGLEVLARSRCTVLPYAGHYGMSRVLVEAAHVGTPVVVHRGGLIGHLAQEHSLGPVVDCNDPKAFGAAVASVVSEDPRNGRREHLAAFAARFSSECFKANIHHSLGL